MHFFQCPPWVRYQWWIRRSPQGNTNSINNVGSRACTGVCLAQGAWRDRLEAPESRLSDALQKAQSRRAAPLFASPKILLVWTRRTLLRVSSILRRATLLPLCQCGRRPSRDGQDGDSVVQRSRVQAIRGKAGWGVSHFVVLTRPVFDPVSELRQAEALPSQPPVGAVRGHRRGERRVVTPDQELASFQKGADVSHNPH